jgi:CheY-like chemotaxis protein
MASTRGEVPRVLIVDDDPTIRTLFSEYYRSAHPDKYFIELAASGYEAGVQVERFKPHVVVLDLMMPDLNGFEVCEKIRTDPSHAAMIIIAITGSEAAATQAKESGNFHRVLLKPVKMSDVKETIDELLAERGFVLDALIQG